jgi:hypothetical protein
MRERSLEDLVAAARTRVAGVRAALTRPRACHLDECVTRLREAQGYLEWLRDSLAGDLRPGGGLRRPLLALETEIRHTGILLGQAARFGRRWLERWQPSASYTADGTFPPMEPRGHMAFFG